MAADQAGRVHDAHFEEHAIRVAFGWEEASDFSGSPRGLREEVYLRSRKDLHCLTEVEGGAIFVARERVRARQEMVSSSAGERRLAGRHGLGHHVKQEPIGTREVSSIFGASHHQAAMTEADFMPSELNRAREHGGLKTPKNLNVSVVL